MLNIQTNKKMSSFFDNRNIIEIIFKWKKHLTVVVILAIILSAIFSGPKFITPLYKSYAVAYPANIQPYSDESTTEQMLQILNSQDIVDSMIDYFNLGEHYNIDKNYKYYKTALLGEYREKVKISKTPYESVMIEVYDKDPVKAKEMVDKLLYFYDKKVDNLHKSKYREVVVMVGKQLKAKKRILDSLKREKARLGSEEGVFEYDYQSQQITKGYLGAIDGSAGKLNKKETNRLYKNMGKYSGNIIELDQLIESESEDYVEVKRHYELAKRFVDGDMTYANIVTHPFVSDKKSFPIRWLVIVVTTLAAFVFALLLIFIVENINRKNS